MLGLGGALIWKLNDYKLMKLMRGLPFLLFECARKYLSSPNMIVDTELRLSLS